MSTLFVCVTCRAGGERFFSSLSRASHDLEIAAVQCLSNCERGCSAAVAAPGKWTYVIGNLDPDRHVDDILRFARSHAAAADGVPVWRERPEHVRKNTIARIPPLKVPA